MNSRLLILDDDISICKIYTLMLNRLGMDVEAVATGEEVLSRYVAAQTAGVPYLAVILDLTVQQGMGGLETLKHLKAINSKVYTIVASGAARETIQSQYLEQGFSDSLPKPFRYQDVADCVARLKAAIAS